MDQRQITTHLDTADPCTLDWQVRIFIDRFSQAPWVTSEQINARAHNNARLFDIHFGRRTGVVEMTIDDAITTRDMETLAGEIQRGNRVRIFAAIPSTSSASPATTDLWASGSWDPASHGGKILNTFYRLVNAHQSDYSTLLVTHNFNGLTISETTFPLLSVRYPFLHFHLAVVMLDGAMEKIRLATQQFRRDFIDTLVASFTEYSMHYCVGLYSCRLLIMLTMASPVSISTPEYRKHVALRAVLRMLLQCKKAEHTHRGATGQLLQFFTTHRAWAAEVVVMLAVLEAARPHCACCPATECAFWTWLASGDLVCGECASDDLALSQDTSQFHYDLFLATAKAMMGLQNDIDLSTTPLPWPLLVSLRAMAKDEGNATTMHIATTPTTRILIRI